MNATPAGWYDDPDVPGQLRYWDGAAWTEHRHRPEPEAPAQPLSGLGLWATLGLAAIALYYFALAVISADKLGSLGAGGLVNLKDLGPSAAAQALAVLAIAAAGSAFITWFYRAYSNLRPLGAVARYSNGWAIGAWFIPIYSLVRGKQMVNDICGGKPPGYVQVWWGLWVLTTALGIGLVIAIFGSGATITSNGDILVSHTAATAWLWLSVVTAVLSIPTVALAIGFVREVTRREDAAIADEKSDGNGQ